MFGNAKRQAARPTTAVPRRHGGNGATAALLRELRAARIEPCVHDTPAGMVAGGATLPVSVAAWLGEESEDAWRRLLGLARAGVPVTLALRELGPGDTASGTLEAFLGTLAARLAAEGISPVRIGLSVPSHVVPLEAYRLLSSALLGDGPRYVVLDGLQMRPRGERAERAAVHNWRFLWRCRATRRPLVPAYASGVSTRCVLLGDEAAGAILPVSGIQVPHESAWLPLSLRLTDFADGGGRLDWARLSLALEAAVDLGEALLDRLCWPDPALAADAAENRRLGIEVKGLGDLVARRGADPSDLASLRWLDDVVARVHALLWDRSRALAREHGPLPSLVRSEPAIGWRCDRSRSHWQERWRRALAESGVRHRNLLVLSPYAILPAGARRASDYIDLLPVLAHADAFAFGGPPAAFESAGEFARFHRRAFAVLERRHAASLVAAGV